MAKTTTTPARKRPARGATKRNTATGELTPEEQAAVDRAAQVQAPPVPRDPMVDFDNKLSALLAEYDPQVGTLAIVKLLRVTADDLTFAAISGMAMQARDQAVQTALSRIGAARNFKTRRNKKAGKNSR